MRSRSQRISSSRDPAEPREDPTLPGLQLALRAVATLPLDECLVGTVTLTAEGEGATVSARVNLIKGDPSSLRWGLQGTPHVVPGRGP